MERIRKITMVVSLSLASCFLLVLTAQSDPPDWANPSAKAIWEISEAIWEDYLPNPRFAIYDVNGDSAADCMGVYDDLVLDKETGLVWLRSATFSSNDWAGATFCTRSAVARGNRRGWRLPTAEELASLLDWSGPGSDGTMLPEGHPFCNVQLEYYWSSTTRESDSSRAWAVKMSDGATGHAPKTHVFGVWPVRGGNGYATGNW